jgi:hypothetical protein
MCRVLGVQRNGYYSFQRTQSLKIEDPDHAEMLEWVKEIAESSHYSYGERRMKKAEKWESEVFGDRDGLPP